MQKFKMIINNLIKGGIILYVLSAPFSISICQVGIITSIACWFTKIIFIDKFRNLKGVKNLNIWILILVLALIISSIFAGDKLASFKGIKFLWQILIMYLIINNVDRKFAKKVILMLLISTSVLSIYGIVQHFHGWDFYRNQQLQPRGRFYMSEGLFNHLTFAGFIMYVFFLSIGLLMTQLKKISNVIKQSAFSILMILSMIFSYARSVWLGLFAGLIVIGAFFNKKTLIVILIFCLLAVALIYSSPDLKKRFVSIFSLKRNADRLTIWRISKDMIKDNPIFGIGSNNFNRLYPKYMRKSDFRGPSGNAHNEYLDIYLTGGILGLLSFLMIIIISFKKIIHAYSQINSDKLKFEKGILLSIIGLIPAFLVSGIAQNYFRDAENAMLLWFILGLGFMIAQHIEREKENA